MCGFIRYVVKEESYSWEELITQRQELTCSNAFHMVAYLLLPDIEYNGDCVPVLN